MRHVLNQEAILTAGINKDKKLAFDAFINDPLVNIPLKDARALFKEMFDHTKEYLPGWEI
jgi:alpha-galactosidase